jgi:glycosyltransferase involved in cell wall biosynthesis
MKIGMVTTWFANCGVSKYSEGLALELRNLVDLKIYAEELHGPENILSEEAKSIPFVRCWNRQTGFDGLYNEIVKDLPDLVNFQHESAMYNSSMFPQDKFLRLVQQLHRAEIPTIITLHNVPAFNPTVPNVWYESLRSKFIVLNKLVERELKKWLPDADVTTIPLGSTIFDLPQKRDVSTFNITQFGFYGQDKGLLPLIEAMPKILQEIPNAKLIFAGSIHPLAPQVHRDYMKDCIKKALELKLQKNVVFMNKFLSEEDTNKVLENADVVAINHQFVSGLFSASASAHRCLCAGRPILMNADDVRLSEFQDGVHCVKAKNEELAEKIIALYKDKPLREKLYKEARKYALETSFEKIAKKHLEVYKQIG